MSTSARLRAAGWVYQRVQACLDRSAALRAGRLEEAAALACWAELRELRAAYWDSEATPLTPPPLS